MKVSIVTPVKNNARYIEECLKSVLSQENCEHILVDGLSTDNTRYIVAHYQHADGKIKFFSKKDNGVYDAWNKGILASTGEILGWLGADDTMPEGTIEAVIKCFKEHPEASLVYGDCNVIDENGKLISLVHSYDFDLKKAINEACPLYTPCVFFKREVVERIGLLDLSVPSSEFDFYLKAAKVFKLQRIERPLANFRLHDGGTTGRNGADFMYARNNYIVARKYGASIFSPRGRNYILMLLTRPFHPFLHACMNNKIVKKIISVVYYAIIGRQSDVDYYYD